MYKNVQLTKDECDFIMENLDKALWYYFSLSKEEFSFDDYLNYCSRLDNIYHSLFY